MHRICWIALLALLTGCRTPGGLGSGGSRDVDLLIVAGQSNAVGFDTAPAALPFSKYDQHILFWWRTGDPPPDEHDSTSHEEWTSLREQSRGNPVEPRDNKERQYGNFSHSEGGFGPEISFARTIRAHSDHPLAVLKVAFSGTGIRQDWDPNSLGPNGSCYRALTNEFHLAAAEARKGGVTLRPRAFLWVQGESDADPKDAAEYADALHWLIFSVRRDFSDPDLNVLLAVNTRFNEGKNDYMKAIVAAQQAVAANDPHCVYVDTSAAEVVNPYHFSTKGTLQVGEWAADALLKMESETKQHRR
ncbi:hypothetical protein GC207_15335 [bacterium]|nr:hypothetical protein [bacterium]